MSQNGPLSQPWSGGSSDEPYTEPADPWGEPRRPRRRPPGVGSDIDVAGEGFRRGYQAPATVCPR